MSVMLYGFREREVILDFFEAVTGLRMNHAYIRIGGVVMDLPEGGTERIARLPRHDARPDRRVRAPAHRQPDLASSATWASGRPAGRGRARARRDRPDAPRVAASRRDVRRDEPYSGYETYEFDVVDRATGDCYARYEVRIEEMRQSLRDRRAVPRAARASPGPVMIEDPKVRWPAQLEVGPDGIGNSEAYVTHIMEESMEALIHHFKMVTEGVSVPSGEVYVPVESPRGELGYYVVSDGGHRPYRVQIRDPSFVNLQARPADGRGRPRRRHDRRRSRAWTR